MVYIKEKYIKKKKNREKKRELLLNKDYVLGIEEYIN